MVFVPSYRTQRRRSAPAKDAQRAAGVGVQAPAGLAVLKALGKHEFYGAGEQCWRFDGQFVVERFPKPVMIRNPVLVNSLVLAQRKVFIRSTLAVQYG